MTLTIHGKELHSLEELRAGFDLDETLTAFLDGGLENWLTACYYERQAEAVRALRLEAANVKKQAETSPLPRRFVIRLCEILGVDYAQYMPDAERPEYERKLAALRRYTDAPELLTRAFETATDHSGLAQLLDEGCKRIVLCGGSFTVPIRVGGVCYTGVGEPKMEAPYTEEQYRRVGIIFEHINLPKECTEQDAYAAREAAADYGYDDFFESHTPFATMLHKLLKHGRLSRRAHLDDGNISCETYRHRYEAESAMKRVVNAAYDRASEFFEPGKPDSIADFAAREYADYLRAKMKPVLDKLPQADALASLTEQAEKRLRELFERELRESADYYRMYQRSYFLGKPEIEDLLSEVDASDNFFLNGLYKMLQREDDYMISGLLETIRELEDDVDSRADSFFSCADGIYRNYCAEIEKAAEELGKTLSDGDLERLGINS